MQPEYQTNPAVYQAGTQDIALQPQRVLRNTYLLLALTMIPTVIGAYIGIFTGGIIMQFPRDMVPFDLMRLHQPA